MTFEEFQRSPLRVVHGIPCFTSDENDQEKQNARILDTIANAKTNGWLDNFSKSNMQGREFVVDKLGYLFLDLVENLDGRQNLLNIGAARDFLSIQLARRYPEAEVYTCDDALEDLMILKIVKEQEGISNLHLAQADPIDIPISDSFFDLILIIEHRETIGSSFTGSRKHMDRILLESSRLLRKKGVLLLGIQKQRGYKNLRDDRIRRDSYSPHQYGRILLDGAGFSKVSCFPAYPSCDSPRIISEMDNLKEMAKYTYTYGFRKFLQYFPNSFLKHIIPSFFIVAEK